jgi:hypothetical protein
MTRFLNVGACAVVAVAALTACGDQESAPVPQPSVLATGAAVTSARFFDTDFLPCSTIELEGYPESLQRASGDYYQGPWCGLRGNERIYLWAYARPFTAGQTTESVSAEVVGDGDQLVLDLLAQGYGRVCGDAIEGQPLDAGFERADDPSRVRVITAGALSPQSSGTVEEGSLTVVADPLSLQVRLSPSQRDSAVADGVAGPPC